jgi:uncharacterized membrane protein
MFFLQVGTEIVPVAPTVRQDFVSSVIYLEIYLTFYVVRAVYLGMKFYNDQRNGHVFNLFIYLLLPYMFRLSLSPSSKAGIQL